MINLESYAGSTEFPVADKGEYEVVLKLERKMTSTNKEYVNLDFKIREDVDQLFKGVHVFDKAWADKTNPQWFDLKKLGTLLVTQKDLPGYKVEFTEVDECIQYLNGIHLRVTIDKVFDAALNKEVNEVKYLSYKPSAWDKEPHEKPAIESSSNLDSIEIPESDLPF